MAGICRSAIREIPKNSEVRDLSRPAAGARIIQNETASSGTEAPRLNAPVGACDCHHHIYDAVRFPPPPQASAPVQRNARVEEYRLLQRRIGSIRDGVVTPSPYGRDRGWPRT